MTPNEHTLMIFMFTRQTLIIKSLIEVLKSRDILLPDDVRAFDSLVLDEELKNNSPAVDLIGQMYQRYAQALGVKVGLSGL